MGIKGEEGKMKRNNFSGLLLLLLCERINNSFIGTVCRNTSIPSSDPIQSMGDLPSDYELSMEQHLMQLKRWL